jgi:hypothetical protein
MLLDWKDCRNQPLTRVSDLSGLTRDEVAEALGVAIALGAGAGGAR